MQRGARIAAAIELLAEIEASGNAADRLIDRYFRARRYAGKGDRAAIANLVWTAIRRRGSIGWLTGTGAASPRVAILAAARLTDFAAADELGSLCDGQGHSPAPLDEAESAALARLEIQAADPPAWVRHDHAAVLSPLLARRYGERYDAVMAAMAGRAPLDLRVNTLKGSREAALAELAGQGLTVSPSPLSPVGIRVEGRERLGQLAIFAEGRVEIQDEGSQLVALLCAARPGEAVADFCAGAGGKALGLAAAMQKKGRLLALDVEARRLTRMAPRLARAGVDQFVEQGEISLELLTAEAGRFDCVLVDAPCSLSGTWRRNPANRWNTDLDRVADLASLQGRILDQAARLVRPGGRLVYATCSVFMEEDEDVVAGFLDRHPGFAVADQAAAFKAATGQTVEAGAFGIALDPVAPGTDGFFVSILARHP